MPFASSTLIPLRQLACRMSELPKDCAHNKKWTPQAEHCGVYCIDAVG